MDIEKPSPVPLAGSLILADPSLRGSGFARSVLLLTNHDQNDGAMGFILNKPAGKKVSELIEIDQMRELADLPVFVGGPVGQDQLTFASLTWQSSTGELDFGTHLSTEEALHRLREGFEVRAFVGYSGWSEGQLEREMEERSWIARKAVPQVADVGVDESLWAELLEDMGPYYELLANCPENPELN